MGLYWEAACCNTMSRTGPGSAHEEGCANKCYLSAPSLGLSESCRPRRGAGGFNWHISYLDAAKLLT